MKEYSLKDDTMNANDLPKKYNYHIYPKGSKIYTITRFVKNDNLEQGVTHRTCFYIKDNADSTSHASSTQKSIYFDSFGGALDKFLLNQLPKPNIYKK